MTAERELARLVDALPPERRARVLTHSSWHEQRGESYERLEFLGDAVLGLVVAAELCDRLPASSEGDLAKVRAQVISRRSCAIVAQELALDRRLADHGEALGHVDAEELAGNASVLAALTEAAIGAVFLEHGFPTVRRAVVEAFDDRIRWAQEGVVDFKTALQEQLQRQGRSVQYVVVDATGPAHRRRFESSALVDGAEVGRGAGSSKKESEQAAARIALGALGARKADA